MLVTIVCLDKPGALDLRMKTRPAHLEWLKRTLPKGALFAGGLLLEDGATPRGSMFIADFESLDSARAWQKADPYQQAGVFGEVTVFPCRNLAPELLAAR